MVSEQPSKKMVRLFKQNGWTRTRTTGSHSTWKCPSAVHSFSLPDGHRTISAGVSREAFKMLESCDCEEETL